MFQLCSTTSVPTLWSMGALSTWVCGTQQVLASSFASETRRSFLLQSTVNQYSYEFYRTGGLQQTAPIELPWCWCFSARLFSYQQSKLRECIKEGNNLALLTYLASPPSFDGILFTLASLLAFSCNDRCTSLFPVDSWIKALCSWCAHNSCRDQAWYALKSHLIIALPRFSELQVLRNFSSPNLLMIKAISNHGPFVIANSCQAIWCQTTFHLSPSPLKESKG